MQLMMENPIDPTGTSAKDRKRREKLAARACVLCNQAHTACDDERPCKRCVSKNIAHLCRDAEPRKRGRPAKLPEQYDLELQQAQRQRTLQQQQQQQQNIMHVTYQSVPMLSLPANAGYNYSSLELTDIDSSLLNDIPLSPFETNSLLIQDMPSPSTMMPQLVNSPPIQMPEVQYLTPVQTPQQSLPLMPTLSQSAITPVNSNNSLAVVEPKPICPPGFGFLSSSCSLQKFSEEHLEQVFTRLANRAGLAEMTPEIKNIMTKVVQFYAPLVSQYGANIMEMCPVRLMSVSQMINENTLPVIVAGCFFMITCNSPAHELTGLKKSDIGRGTMSNWKFIFDLIHKDDAIPFIKKSVECLTGFTDLDRMKVRLSVPDGVFECVVSETIHRNSNGVPLFSSFTFVRIDDLR